jgi:hypothetical protein
MEVRGQGGDAPCDPDICWTKEIGSVSTSPYYPVSPPTYGQNAEETYMEYRTPDVDNPGYSVTQPLAVDSGLGAASMMLNLAQRLFHIMVIIVGWE